MLCVKARLLCGAAAFGDFVFCLKRLGSAVTGARIGSPGAGLVADAILDLVS